MKRLAIQGVAIGLLAALPSAPVQSESNMAPGMRAMPGMKASAGAMRHNWGGKRDGRWIGGWRAPGGWAGYRPAFRGFILPRYWISPAFYIGDYRRYGFSTPAAGYGWSRYYDDAVLTDRYGRVHDSVRGVQWDRYDDYRDDGYDEDYADSWGYRADAPPPAPRAPDRDKGLGGAAVGAAVGAVAGAAIAGKGDRTAGALIGGGLGALGGAAVDLGDRAGRGYKEPELSKHERRTLEREYRRGYPPRGPLRRDWDDDDYGPHWGHWEDRENHSSPPIVHHNGPHHGSAPVVIHQHGGGWGWGGETTVITIQSQPVVTTTTTTTEEVVYASATRKRYAAKKKVWKPRPKPRCVCK